VCLLLFRRVHSAVTPGESRFRLHCNGALVMGINVKLRRDIHSPDFSTCLLFIQLVWMGCCRYDTIEEFNVDWKAEYSALSSTRRSNVLSQPE